MRTGELCFSLEIDASFRSDLSLAFLSSALSVYNRELPKVQVYPLYLSENELTSKSILAM